MNVTIEFYYEAFEIINAFFQLHNILENQPPNQL